MEALRACTLGLLALTLPTGVAVADVVLDGSTGSRKDLRAPHGFTIPADVGQRKGKNLLHSFERFGINQDQTAIFTGPTGIDNVISRVTGNERSDINGTLISEIPGADFWFINPAGVVFGEGAKVDVPAALHVSTADYVRFEDGQRFSALDRSAPPNLTLRPEAFGFLTSRPQALSMSGRVIIKQGSPVSLVGGDVLIDGGRFWTSEVENAKGSELRLVSVAGPAEVRFTDTGVDVAPEAAVGSVRVSNAEMDLYGNRGGRLLIRGGELTMERTKVLLQNNGSANPDHGGPSVDVQVAGAADLQATTFNANGESAGKAGDVAVRAGTITIKGGRISTVAAESGNAESGTIQITADRLTITDGAELSTLSDTGEPAGEVSLRGGVIELLAGADIEADSRTVQGTAGRIVIEASERLTASGVTITAEIDDGSAGRIDLTGPVIHLTNGTTASISRIGEGQPGLISIDAGELTVNGDSHVVASNKGDVTSTGRASDIVIRARTVTVGDGSISALAQTAGEGGKIDMAAADIRLLPGATIGASSEENSTGRAGSIRLVASGEFVMQGATVKTFTHEGKGGSIEVRAGDLRMSDQALIDTSTTAGGDAGGVSVSAAQSIHLQGSGTRIISNTYGDEASAGDGGVVRVSAPDVAVVDGAQIATLSEGAAPAGDVFVSADELVLDGGTISSASDRAGGGRVDIRATELVYLKDGAITTAVRGGAGDAGDIFIDPRFLVLDNGRIVADADAGQGGNIRISAGLIIRDQDSVIDASSRLGVAGTVVVNSPEANVAGRVAPVQPELLDPGSLMAEACPDRSGEPRSSLVRGFHHRPADDPGRPVEPTLIANRLPADGDAVERGTLQAANAAPDHRSRADREIGGCPRSP